MPRKTLPLLALAACTGEAGSATPSPTPVVTPTALPTSTATPALTPQPVESGTTTTPSRPAFTCSWETWWEWYQYVPASLATNRYW